ncbi:hypothetical protein [Lederbergia panacisoli]|uniref:hypothetical protein n=1 Tax=Lederbergia panacisoli TaxID=1255251 RepID=UPI00214CDB47|nr:hypothetical protein [Lederbergia panacisoli]MCR2823460.1 hypothetical protein [Lederbergia panacisoli]
MKNLFSYFPIACLLIILFGMEVSYTKLFLIVFAAILIVLAKYVRSKRKDEDIVFDDRVNVNITKWSLRIVYVMNSALFLLLVFEYKGILDISIHFILIYLVLTLFIPFYVTPSILKKF